MRVVFPLAFGPATRNRRPSINADAACECPMQVHSDTARQYHVGAFGEAAIKAGPRLGEAPAPADRAQGVDGHAKLLGSNQNISVEERTQLRLGIVQVGVRRTLQDPPVEIRLVEEIRDAQKLCLYVSVVLCLDTAGVERLHPLLGGHRQGSVVDGML
jgi:hypothetical protein